MLFDLTPEQRALADFMSELSEEAFCAGWMLGLEYALWEAVFGLRASYGRLILGDQEIARLGELSRGCGGWIVFDDNTEETWLPRGAWEMRFATWAGRSNGEPGRPPSSTE